MRKTRIAAGTAAVTAAVVVATATTAAGDSKPTLVVYSAQGYDKAVVDAFQKATGIPTKLDDNSTGPLLTQIEASKNNPNWSVLWVDGDPAFAGLDRQGLLLKDWEPAVTWNSLGKRVAAWSWLHAAITFLPAILISPVRLL